MLLTIAVGIDNYVVNYSSWYR